jgi:hypothetical protein
MKTLKTFLAVILLTGFSGAVFSQSLLQKAKDAAKNSKDKKATQKVPDTKKKGGKEDKMGIKGTGVPTNSTVKPNSGTAPSGGSGKQ